MSLLTVTAAFVRRRWAEDTVRWTPLIFSTAALAAGLMSQAYLGRLVDAGTNRVLGDYQGHFAAFLLVGVVLLDLQTALASGLSSRIREAQLSGSLETMLATPTPTGTLLFGLLVPDVLWALGRVALYALFGVAFFGVELGAANLGGAALVLLLALGAFGALALVSAALTMLLRRANPLSMFLTSAALIASGVIYPRNILPAALAWAGELLPIAPALDGVRAAVVQGAGVTALVNPLARLGVFIFTVGPLGAWLFARSLSRARSDGSLTSF